MDGLISAKFSEIQKFNLFKYGGRWRTQEAIEQRGSSPATFNSGYIDKETTHFGLIAGKASQIEADNAAKEICQKKQGAVRCEKLYGDGLKCIALGFSTSENSNGTSTDYFAIGTADTLENAKIKATNLCRQSNKNITYDACVAQADMAICAN